MLRGSNANESVLRDVKAEFASLSKFVHNLAEGLRSSVEEIEHKIGHVVKQGEALEYAVGEIQNDLQELQYMSEEDKPREQTRQDAPASQTDRVTAAPAPLVFSVPEARPLFGSSHAVGDHARETAESEASFRLGSQAGE